MTLIPHGSWGWADLIQRTYCILNAVQSCTVICIRSPKRAHDARAITHNFTWTNWSNIGQCIIIYIKTLSPNVALINKSTEHINYCNIKFIASMQVGVLTIKLLAIFLTWPAALLSLINLNYIRSGFARICDGFSCDVTRSFRFRCCDVDVGRTV